MTDDIITIIITAVLTGGFTTITTVAALRVHIMYLRERLNDIDASVKRAHARLDQHERDTWIPNAPRASGGKD